MVVSVVLDLYINGICGDVRLQLDRPVDTGRCLCLSTASRRANFNFPGSENVVFLKG